MVCANMHTSGNQLLLARLRRNNNACLPTRQAQAGPGDASRRATPRVTWTCFQANAQTGK